MNKNKGFTLIELLVVILFAAFLAVITIPSMMRWYNKDLFISESRQIIDSIDDARANALSEKKCSDGSNSSSESWNWSWEASTKKINLSCSYAGGNIYEEDVFSLDKNIAVTSNQFFYYNNSSTETLFNSSQKNFSISFPSGDTQSTISVEDSTLGEYDIKKIKLPFVFTGEEALNRTICFNRIAGFPTISSTENCND